MKQYMISVLFVPFLCFFAVIMDDDATITDFLKKS